MHKKLSWDWVAPVVLAAILPVAGWSQSFNATISGSVSDPSGASVPDVELTLTAVATGAVAAVVAEGDGLGEGHIEAGGPGHGGGHLGDLEGVGQPGALVVVGEDEHLGLARQAAEGGQPATYQPLLLGITKASLSTQSFISSASFRPSDFTFGLELTWKS